MARCSSITKAGEACKATPLPGSQFCFAHDPAQASVRSEGQRKGGRERSATRKAAKLWASLGDEIADNDLGAILKSTMWMVKEGEISPAAANAIAGLARTAVQVTNDLELETRLKAVEDALEGRSNLRRMY